MCDHADREAAMVVIERAPGSGRPGRPTVWCDPCLAPIIRALLAGGVRTVASCCGHGKRPGVIALADGRELIIARDFDEARLVERAVPVDINGEVLT